MKLSELIGTDCYIDCGNIHQVIQTCDFLKDKGCIMDGVLLEYERRVVVFEDNTFMTLSDNSRINKKRYNFTDLEIA